MFEKQKIELQVRSEPVQIQAFQTSIWDETLYAVSGSSEKGGTATQHAKSNNSLFVAIGMGKNYSLFDTKYKCTSSKSRYILWNLWGR
jgi:hypothetical protein